MKNLFTIGLFIIVLNCVYGQTRTENKWLIGTWSNTYTEEFRNDKNSIERWNITETWIFNDNGSGKRQLTGIHDKDREEYSSDFLFSINQTGEGILITVYFLANNVIELIDGLIIDRINDQRFITINDGRFVLNEETRIFDKRN